jgi:hypothetical protein
LVAAFFDLKLSFLEVKSIRRGSGACPVHR